MATTSPDNIWFPDADDDYDLAADLGTMAESIQEAVSSQIPVGFISMVAHPLAKPDEGWLWCDGSEVPRSTYADLFSVIGVTYGNGNGSTTFNLPNFNGRMPAGIDPQDSDFDAYGRGGGEKKHTLTVNEIPSHGHTASTESAGGHTHASGGLGRFMTTNRATAFGNREAPTATTGAAFVPAYAGDGTQSVSSVAGTATGGAHTHPVTVNNSGGGQAHNNMPPFLTVGFVIRA